MLREMDEQRRKEDPTFLGAFHEKKEKNTPSGKDRLKAKSKMTGAKKPTSRPTGPRSGASARKSGGPTSGAKRSGAKGGRR
jgi:ATP-dependent RNA helicase RhlE